MPEIMRIAEAHGLAVFEDCAQAHAAAIGSTPVGAFGAWGSFKNHQPRDMILVLVEDAYDYDLVGREKGDNENELTE